MKKIVFLFIFLLLCKSVFTQHSISFSNSFVASEDFFIIINRTQYAPMVMLGYSYEREIKKVKIIQDLLFHYHS